MWLHAVDLNGDPAVTGVLPLSWIDSLLDEIAPAVGSRPDTASFGLAPTDRDRRWSTNSDRARVTVEGPAADLLAWLTGRDKVGASLHVQDEAPLPNLSAWL